MKNFLKMLGTAILFFGLSSSATAANTANNGLTQLSTKPMVDSPYALDCKEAVGGKNCSLIKKGKLTNSQLTKVNGSGITEGYAIATDRSDNVYIAGFTSIGLNGREQHGNYDYFVISYDVKGNMKWTQQVGAPGSDSDTVAQSIAIDSSGNVYITGYTTVGINGQRQNGYKDYFIVKYTASGIEQWTQQIGASGGDIGGNGIAIDNDNDIYITGYTTIGINGQKQNGSIDYFIVKYDTNGNLKWTQQVGALNGITYGQSIAIDNENNVYITGYTNVGINGQKQNGYDDYFIVKYTVSGTELWTQQVGVKGGLIYANGIATDRNGNVYITGDTDVGINGQQQHGFRDYFVVKYTASGMEQWTQQVGASKGTTIGSNIGADINGNVYVTGYTQVKINGQKQNGYEDYFVVSYYPNGKVHWTRQVGAYGGATRGREITTNSSGNVYVTGFTLVGINGQPQNGAYDAFAAGYNSDGTLLWGNQVGG